MDDYGDCLFEMSWEVCNKVGGIYTVISSKASEVKKRYADYYMIGPYFDHNARLDFLRLELPEDFAKVFSELETEGIKCYYGQLTDISCRPYAVLIDFSGIINRKNSIKSEFWEDYKIDSLRGYWDFEEPSLWAYAAGRLIEKFSNLKRNIQGMNNYRVVVQCHEWLSAFGLLYLKKNCKSISTVFTAHATVLGRSIAGNGQELYSIMQKVDPLQQAYTNCVEAKFLSEKAAALNADIFTTVSGITAIEAKLFLGRNPEIITFNGLEMEDFYSVEDMAIKHISSRERIKEFLKYYFFPYYPVNVDRPLFFYTTGRFEFRNKGSDILIRALARLNETLKSQLISGDLKRPPELPRSIFFFFWIPMQHYGMRMDVLENQKYYMHIKGLLEMHSQEIMTRLLYDFISKKDYNDGLFTENFLREIKKDLIAFERNGLPPLSTHNMDENSNVLIRSLRENGLLNRKDDVVKIIVEPVYLDGTDAFIGLNNYDAMAGCHLGIFPSYYEPWGYTPLESVSLAVPALTTDLTGFGMFVKDSGLQNSGVYVLERLGKNDDEAVEGLFRTMLEFFNKPHDESVDFKIKAKRVSEFADWKKLVENYINAYRLAVKKSLSRVDAK